MFRCGLQHVEQRRHKGVDAAAEILKIDEDNVESVHHRICRPSHSTIKAEDRDVMQRIEKIGRLDHIVLFVAAQPVLRPERGSEIDAAVHERIERVRQMVVDRRRVGEQRDSLFCERRAQLRLGKQTIDSKFHKSPQRVRFQKRA